MKRGFALLLLFLIVIPFSSAFFIFIHKDTSGNTIVSTTACPAHTEIDCSFYNNFQEDKFAYIDYLKTKFNSIPFEDQKNGLIFLLCGFKKGDAQLRQESSLGIININPDFWDIFDDEMMAKIIDLLIGMLKNDVNHDDIIDVAYILNIMILNLDDEIPDNHVIVSAIGPLLSNLYLPELSEAIAQLALKLKNPSLITDGLITMLKSDETGPDSNNAIRRILIKDESYKFDYLIKDAFLYLTEEPINWAKINNLRELSYMPVHYILYIIDEHDTFDRIVAIINVIKNENIASAIRVNAFRALSNIDTRISAIRYSSDEIPGFEENKAAIVEKFKSKMEEVGFPNPSGIEEKCVLQTESNTDDIILSDLANQVVINVNNARRTGSEERQNLDNLKDDLWYNRYGVRPRNHFGYINSEDEKRLIKSVLRESSRVFYKDGFEIRISPEFLYTVTMMEGLSTNMNDYYNDRIISGFATLGLDNFGYEIKEIEGIFFNGNKVSQNCCCEWQINEKCQITQSIDFENIEDAIKAMSLALIYQRYLFFKDAKEFSYDVNNLDKVQGMEGFTNENIIDFWTYFYYNAVMGYDKGQLSGQRFYYNFVSVITGGGSCDDRRGYAAGKGLQLMKKYEHPEQDGEPPQIGTADPRVNALRIAASTDWLKQSKVFNVNLIELAIR